MFLESTIVPIIVLAIGGLALLFLFLDKYPMEIIGLGLISLLAILKLIFPDSNSPELPALLSGFANPGLITVMALLVMAEGMVASGVISSLINNI